MSARRVSLPALLFGACAAGALASGASADDASNEIQLRASDRVYVDGERVEGEDLSASAMKTLTPLVDVPQSLTSFDAGLLAETRLTTYADIARYVPGVQFGQGEGHRDAPTIRGQATTADFYVDGVRDDVQYFRDPYNAERIDILKGPNALIFGRGGGGGVINRISKAASFEDFGEVALTGGSFETFRGAFDANAQLTDNVAARLNALYENADSFRDFVGVEKIGINPTATARLGERTFVTGSYEYFRDQRDVDRGVPSVDGLPFRGDRTAFFGAPNFNEAEAEVNLFNFSFVHAFSDDLSIRNRTLYGDYNKFYANVQPNTPVDENGVVGLQNYFSTTDRENLFSQTDLVWNTTFLGLGHTLLAGFEVGNQDTLNFRQENNNAAGTVTIDAPSFFGPIVFNPVVRNDNQVDLTTASVYLQDQIDVTDWLKLVGGVRFDHFDLEFDDNRPELQDFQRTDDLFSPRGGVIFKPAENASIYASYSFSFLPQSGDQFGSLSVTTAALEPERFENIEVGVKWDLTPELAVTGAIYRLDRTNTRAIDPITALTVLTGEQRSRGIELGLTGQITPWWTTVIGYALQDAEITSETASATPGTEVPLVPRHEFSAWNRFQATERLGLGVGVNYRSDVFASISNNVTLPAYTRVDVAGYYALNDALELQVNLENLFNAFYFPTAHNDNNITPGAPRSVFVTLRARL
ncbi:MAG: TonB-dependent receptor [Parvularculaceae bacterium]